jgi:hypothetical protein
MSLAEQVQSEVGVKLSRVAAALWDRYGTPHKLANAKRLQNQRNVSAEQVDAFPWRVILDPHGGCNIRCENCAAHAGDLPHGALKLADVDLFLADLWPHLVQVNLFNWGEPFLNRRLGEVVARIHGRGVGTHIHSNLNYMPEDQCRGVIEGGLDFIIASIDGATQEVYHAYRQGGELSQVLKNLELMIRLRNKAGSHLRIIWRFLCFPHNLHEIEPARKMAQGMGVDEFAIGEGNLHGQTWTPDGPKQLAGTAAGRLDTAAASDWPLCGDLWDFPAIHFDGSLMPCCYADSPQFVWATLSEQTWNQAYNTPGFIQARRLAGGQSVAGSPCLDCERMAPMKRKMTSGLSLQVLRQAI